MRKKIQNAIVLVISVVLVLVYILASFLIYDEAKYIRMEELRREAAYIEIAVNSSGSAYLEQLDDVEVGTEIRLLDRDGTVLYDSNDGREELEGELCEVTMPLDDGRMLSVATHLKPAYVTMLELLPVMLFVGILMLLLAYSAAKIMSKHLIEPINTINLEHPLLNPVYEELQPLLVRIEEQNHAKDELSNQRREFSTNVSHQLRTPLTSILGYSELMKEGMVQPEDLKTFADRIYLESREMSRIIQELIARSHLEDGGPNGT